MTVEGPRYKGSLSPEQYKRGEHAYRAYCEMFEEYEILTISFRLPEDETVVSGPITRLFRDELGVPYAELQFLEIEPQSRRDTDFAEFMSGSKGIADKLDAILSLVAMERQLRELGVTELEDKLGVVDDKPYLVSLAMTIIVGGKFQNYKKPLIL